MIRQKKKRVFKIINSQVVFQTFNKIHLELWKLMKLNNKHNLSKIFQQDFIIHLIQVKKMKNSISTRKCNNLQDKFYSKNFKFKKTKMLKQILFPNIKIYLSKNKKDFRIKTEN